MNFSVVEKQQQSLYELSLLAEAISKEASVLRSLIRTNIHSDVPLDKWSARWTTSVLDKLRTVRESYDLKKEDKCPTNGT